jgi:hypothetical protein
MSQPTNDKDLARVLEVLGQIADKLGIPRDELVKDKPKPSRTITIKLADYRGWLSEDRNPKQG